MWSIACIIYFVYHYHDICTDSTLNSKHRINIDTLKSSYKVVKNR